MQATIAAILRRHHALGIRPVDAQIFVHQGRDSGCLRHGSEFLRAFTKSFRHALVLFDREGCGKEVEGRAALEERLEKQLAISGWEERAAAVVLDPELEAWVWSDSPQVLTVLGWRSDLRSLREWLEERKYVAPEVPKPHRPKEAMQAILRLNKKPQSASLFQELARTVSLDRCQDQAFQKLKETLVSWFPAVRAS
jgi:hypothetical protein